MYTVQGAYTLEPLNKGHLSNDVCSPKDICRAVYQSTSELGTPLSVQDSQLGPSGVLYREVPHKGTQVYRAVPHKGIHQKGTLINVSFAAH